MAERMVLLISGDVSTRSHLRARLVEEGCQVFSFQSIRDACHWTHLGGRVPSMVVIDIWRDDTYLKDLGWLKDLSDRSPVLFIAGHRDQIPSGLEAFGEILRRPVSVGEIVSRIRSRV